MQYVYAQRRDTGVLRYSVGISWVHGIVRTAALLSVADTGSARFTVLTVCVQVAALLPLAVVRMAKEPHGTV